MHIDAIIIYFNNTNLLWVLHNISKYAHVGHMYAVNNNIPLTKYNGIYKKYLLNTP
jgi:hypothetical protein